MMRLVIFDLDGTLLDTLGDLAAACNDALTRHGLPTHPNDDYRLFVGDGIFKLIERMTPPEKHRDTALLYGLKADFDNYYKEHCEDLTKPYDGILEMVEALQSRGVALSVLSNKPHVFTRTLVSKFFGDRIAPVYGHREGYPTKPDKSLVTEILQEMGIPAEHTVYIGDSGVDMQTAVNGGVYPVGALWGFRGREELLKNGAKAVIAHPMELVGLLDTENA